MSPSVRRHRTLRGIILCCAALLFAAQTLALAHVHVDDGACVVCPHAHNQVAADVGAFELADAAPCHDVQRAAGDRAVPCIGTTSFQARAPPASGH